jgi:wyosine [tRNA(Phe)-imidazoG37] synthetase (radical SAM superfamily)
LKPPNEMEDFFGTHSRSFEALDFVYPVISRRSGGLSLGINLNPDKACNFDCRYCQVDRSLPSPRDFNVKQAMKEIEFMGSLIRSGKIFTHPEFLAVPTTQRNWMDVSIAGDGEPSISKKLLPLMQRLKLEQKNLPQVVLLSNATGFDKKDTRQALKVLAEINGAVWAKLDGGSQEFFEQVSGSPFELKTIVANIKNIPESLSLKIQTCFMFLNNTPPSEKEIYAYKDQIKEILKGRRISEIQIYTLARQPANSTVKALSLKALKVICRPLEDLPLKISSFSGSAD